MKCEIAGASISESSNKRTRSGGRRPAPYVWVRATTSYPTGLGKPRPGMESAHVSALTLVQKRDSALQLLCIGPGHIQIVEHGVGETGGGRGAQESRR